MPVDPSIFISYAHEDQSLAVGLARAMEARGARVWIDQGELLIGDSLLERISEAIAEFDFVAALVSEASIGSNWCQKEIALAMSRQLKRGARGVTVLPLQVGGIEMPASLRDVVYQPLDPNDIDSCAARLVSDASRHLARVQAAPAKAKPRPPAAATKSPVDDEEIKIIGVDTDAITQPRNDDTRGSALYRIPLILNRTPSDYWRNAFPQVWDRPPQSTQMHRPGIASVSGNRIVLDGTTIGELEKYHLTTLKLVVRELNRHDARHQAQQRAEAEAAERRRREHDDEIAQVTARLRFD